MAKHKITFACMDLDEAEYDLLCTLLNEHVAKLEAQLGNVLKNPFYTKSIPAHAVPLSERYERARNLLWEMQAQDGRKDSK